MENYSVLLLVYKGEEPANFREAIQSMLDQTVLTDDFVIVCDGPLTGELDGVIADFEAKYPGLFQILRLPQNVGVGLANRAGLELCRNELVAKMDSDDIALPDRCRLQLERFAQKPELAVLGGYIEEFDNATGKPFAIRAVPVEEDAVRTYARRRNPINNVTAMYRKSAAMAVGSYPDLRRGEDYDLYLRMLMKGYRIENMPRTLVRVRVDADSHRRRTSWAALKGCAGIWWNAYREGYSSAWDLMVCLVGQMVLILCPARVQQMLYLHLLRKKCDTKDE